MDWKSQKAFALCFLDQYMSFADHARRFCLLVIDWLM
jgi:hypothetical protein